MSETIEPMPAYRFINATHTLVLRDDHVIAWDPKGNAPAAQPSAAPPLLPVRKPTNEVDEPFDNREHQARASLLGARPAAEPPDEMKLWRDAGSPQPTGGAPAATAAGAPGLPSLANTMTSRFPIQEQKK